ncbi:MAG: hypothetical protein ACREGR_03955, partial [Minisyncoccia bacterium]
MLGYPPQPVYPVAYDSDYTLFLVYNTTESILAENNQAWSQEIAICPVGNDQTELWADNGFGNIGGELFYYDAVDKNTAGKIIRLKRCVRNLGGVQTHYNDAGIKVRGYVVAEHHNQLVDAVLNIEKFVGENFSLDHATLDWRIRNLRATPPIFDDFDCPDVDFQFNIISNNPASGIVAEYIINVQGTPASFRLDFGDGTFDVTNLRGQHTYAVGAIIDPVLTFTNNNCTLVQTPYTRTEPVEPETLAPVDFFIPLPELFTFPTIGTPSAPSIGFPNLPPIVFPCLDLSPISAVRISSIFVPPFPALPSLITITPVNMPSVISITPVTLPSTITITPPTIPSTITITPPNIPSVISIPTPNIPSTITITPPTIPSTITIT